MKIKAKMIMIVLLLVILILLMLCSNDLLKLKQIFVFGVEQFKSTIDNTEDTDIKIDLPIYAKNTASEKGHPGYCFIGDTDGTRHCVELEPDDKCVSGQIHSSKEVCVNPELRN